MWLNISLIYEVIISYILISLHAYWQESFSFWNVANKILRPWRHSLHDDECDSWSITSSFCLQCCQTLSKYRYRVKFRDIIVSIMIFMLKTIATNIRVWIMNSKWSGSTKELFGLFRSIWTIFIWIVRIPEEQNPDFSDLSGPCQVMISKVITSNELQVM